MDTLGLSFGGALCCHEGLDKTATLRKHIVIKISRDPITTNFINSTFLIDNNDRQLRLSLVKTLPIAQQAMVLVLALY